MNIQNRHVSTPFLVLMADDDPDDVSLVSDALFEAPFSNLFRSVHNGFELVQYLHGRGKYAGQARPSLILLDLNMPLQNGAEALAEIKSTPGICNIPVVILTTSDAERDRLQTVSLGADQYLTKPSSYKALVKMMQSLQSFHTAHGSRGGN
jgi:CheY-like chemotaxis protein